MLHDDSQTICCSNAVDQGILARIRLTLVFNRAEGSRKIDRYLLYELITVFSYNRLP